jgi:predicted transposase/invertase (TIGR01784 family)
MSHAVFADPKTDFVFQRIFGSEEHKPLLIALLNALLGLDEAHRIVHVDLLPPEQRPKIRELKYSIVDVKCADAAGTRYVVEMQVLYVEAFEKRVLYNVAKAFVGQLAVGNPYPQLNDVIGVSICNFELWPREVEPHVPMLSRWRMVEQHSGARGIDQLQLVFLELPKLDRSREPETIVEKWAYFFREAPNLEVVPAPLAAERPLVDAFEAARLSAFTKDEWDSYTAQLIAIQDEMGVETGAMKRGHAEGLREGRLEAIEMLCDVLEIPLDAARRARLAALDAAGLEALLQTLRARRAWE